MIVLKVRRVCDAHLRDVEQHLIGVVPGMAGFVMRRDGHQSVGLGRVPIGNLALKIDAVAGRAEQIGGIGPIIDLA